MWEEKSFAITNYRKSNLELLRIISMILIVAHHFSKHSDFNFLLTEISINRLWIQFIQMGGKIGVNIFVLISGYFLIDIKKIKITKILKFWCQIFSYSLIIMIIFVLTGLETIELKEIRKHILPITFSNWWFASTYFVLYIFSPYLNKLLTSLDKMLYRRLIIIATICWCVIPTFLNCSFQSNNLIWFMYLYSLSGYLRLYPDEIKISSKNSIKIALLFVFATFFTVIICDIIGKKIEFIGKNATYLYGMQKLPIVIISIFLFNGFLKSELKFNKIINTLAKATFGVYLIHDDDYIRVFLWKKLFKNYVFINSKILIPYSIVVVLIVYALCTCIELFRIVILEEKYMKYIEKISKYIEEKLKIS